MQQTLATPFSKVSKGIDITLQVKRCAKCDTTKPVSEFGKSSQIADGFKSYCRKCDAVAAAESRERKRIHDSGEPCDCKTCVRKANAALGLKRCNGCGEAKPYGEFQKLNSAKDGLQTYCAECANASNRPHQRRRAAQQHGNSCGCKTCAAGAKECPGCRHVKPLSEFHLNAASGDGLQSRCKRCTRLDRYNLTEAEFLGMLESQECRCAVCSREIAEDTLVIDHDHRCCPGDRTSCGHCVRGLLCRKCNSASGFLEEDLNNALALAAYLMRSEDVLQLAKDS